MWMGLQHGAKGLRDTDDAGPSAVVACGVAHQLVDCFVGEPCELGEKLTISHEEGAQHFWQGERPHGVPDVFEQLVFEKGGESGRTFRIA